MKIGFKKLTENATMPKYNHSTDAGIDVFAAEDTYIPGFEDYMTTVEAIYGLMATHVDENTDVNALNTQMNDLMKTIEMFKTRALVPTNIAWEVLEIKEGYKAYLKVEDTSGNAWKHGIKSMAGVIDQDYRGDIGVVLNNTTMKGISIKKGDKIAQLIAYEIPLVTIEEITETSDTQRGEQGFGESSGTISN